MLEISDHRRKLYDLISPSLDFLKMKKNNLKNAIRAGIKFKSQGEVVIARSRMTDNPPLLSPNSLHR